VPARVRMSVVSRSSIHSLLRRRARYVRSMALAFDTAFQFAVKGAPKNGKTFAP
jgi:hypothetical protein